MIHVVAIIETWPGQRDAVLSEFRTIIPAVHAEKGCIEYGPVIDATGTPDAFGPDRFVVIEKWSGMDALSAHAKAPHMIAYGKKVAPMLASRAIHVLEPC